MSPSASTAPEPSVAVVIPTLNEAGAIGKVILEIPRDLVREIIVADSGSTDGTAEKARAAGARVLSLSERGYGRACAAGAAAAPPDCDIIAFLDGDGSDRGDLLGALIHPIRAGSHDFVITSRARGEREPGAMSWHQLFAGYLAGLLTFALYGVRYTDICAFRAIRRSALRELGMREMTYGWNVEMQLKAARAGLRILEIPIPYRRRAAGESKVAGTVRGTIRAGCRIVLTCLRVAVSASE
jgi:glycosyltransferase involved in cell wall biosynthesis